MSFIWVNNATVTFFTNILQVLALDKRYLDPRRSVNPTQQEKEEGIIPLTDSLPIIPQVFVSVLTVFDRGYFCHDLVLQKGEIINRCYIWILFIIVDMIKMAAYVFVLFNTQGTMMQVANLTYGTCFKCMTNFLIHSNSYCFKYRNA